MHANRNPRVDMGESRSSKFLHRLKTTGLNVPPPVLIATQPRRVDLHMFSSLLVAVASCPRNPALSDVLESCDRLRLRPGERMWRERIFRVSSHFSRGTVRFRLIVIPAPRCNINFGAARSARQPLHRKEEPSASAFPAFEMGLSWWLCSGSGGCGGVCLWSEVENRMACL